VWRLLQGGELIAPVPALPPRETKSDRSDRTAIPLQSGRSETLSNTPGESGEATPSQPIKKTRTRKKAQVPLSDPAESGSPAQIVSGKTPPVTAPKRSRKKKNTDDALSPIEMEVRPLSLGTSEEQPALAETDTGSTPPAKPKRARRVGEPKPKRYPVGEQEADQSV